MVVWFGAAHVLLLLARSWPAERAGSVGERRGQRRETRLGEESRPSSCLTSETLRRQIPQLRMHSRRFFQHSSFDGCMEVHRWYSRSTIAFLHHSPLQTELPPLVHPFRDPELFTP